MLSSLSRRSLTWGCHNCRLLHAGSAVQRAHVLVDLHGRQQAPALEAAQRGAALRRPGAPPPTCASRGFSQDRISTDGSLVAGGGHPAAAPYVIGASIAGGDSPAPTVPPASEAEVEELAEFVLAARGSLVVLTGAGCSTESDIPDYRSPNGAYSTGFRPMTHQQFMASEENRSRYWARSFAGWPKFKSVAPNAAHRGIAALQRAGWAQDCITQNVDRLHHSAGSSRVLELHGTTHRVVCMSCGEVSCRDELQARMAAANPAAAAALAGLDAGEDALRMLRAGTAAPVHPSLQERGLELRPDGEAAEPAAAPRPVQRPDGDVELGAGAGQGFAVPPCLACAGVLKPWVVFFGDSLPPERAAAAADVVGGARALLVVGSSLAVYSAYRLAKVSRDLGIVTVGPTRADDLAGFKLEARAGDVLARLAAHPALQAPP